MPHSNAAGLCCATTGARFAMRLHAVATARMCGDDTARAALAPHQGLCPNIVSNFLSGYSEIMFRAVEALLVVALFEGEAFSGADGFA
jgi:hypothetical protein